MSTISVNLKIALQRVGMTSRELAARTGVDESTVSLWLSGQRTPIIKNLRTIADTLGVNVVELLVGSQHELSSAQQSVLADMAALPDNVQYAIAAMVSAVKTATESK